MEKICPRCKSIFEEEGIKYQDRVTKYMAEANKDYDTSGMLIMNEERLNRFGYCLYGLQSCQKVLCREKEKEEVIELYKYTINNSLPD